ncbi:MAG TPA: DUF1015 domain-containing protein, partial [Acidimicrobiales bacterium]|nr:DUF1015 domain-containing protein [Acidimicrobiales bacterium]
MPRFEPFAGLRYDPSVPLDLVIAPPYDVVNAAQREELAARHRANAIHVELPADDAARGLDRYQAAAAILEAWMDEGLVLQDAAPAFYAYRMRTPAGEVTTGVIGALYCEQPGGEILPHEQTIPKDKSDRLDLLRSCHANLSPIWGLSLTAGLAKAYEPEDLPDAEATDDDGVVHSLWVLDDPAVVAAISEGVAQSPVVIADGHHRYETALAYQAERRHETGDAAGDYDAVMALVVELAEDQLSVGPIHRTLSGVPEGVDVADAFGRWFDMVQAGPVDEQLVTAVSESNALALVTGGSVWLLTPRPEAYEAAGSDLDSSVVALAVEGIDGAATTHHHDVPAAMAALASGEAQAALLLRPVTVAQIGDWAHARRR